MANQIITVHSNITYQIYRSYMNFHVFRRDKGWVKLVLYCFAFIIFGIFNLKANSPILGSIFIGLAIYVLVSRFLRFYMSVNRIADTFQLTNVPRLFYTIKVCHSDIEIHNEKENATYTWNQVHHAYRVKDMIYLYFTQQTAFLLPSTNIEGGDMDSLWALICTSLPSEKVTKID